MRRRYLRKIESQLESSARYKAGLRRRGIPLRDDLARAFFSEIIEELAEMREAEQVDRFEKWIDRIVSALPKRFDRDKSEAVVRAMVSRYIAEHDRSEGEQEAA